MDIVHYLHLEIHSAFGSSGNTQTSNLSTEVHFQFLCTLGSGTDSINIKTEHPLLRMLYLGSFSSANLTISMTYET